jgi:serine O-acetyltransferase
MKLLAQWAEDLDAHGRDWTRPGFRAVAAHRFAQWRNGLRLKLLRAPLSLIYRAMFRRCRNVYGIEIPETARLGRRVVFEHQGAVVIHPCAVIGDGCVIRQGVTLGVRHDGVQEAPVLGRRVRVGAGAKILGPVFVGDDARIGANAVVLCDVPAGATAVGVPARILPAARHEQHGGGPGEPGESHAAPCYPVPAIPESELA